MDRKKHCFFCGEQLTEKFVDGRQRLFCVACNRPIYENPIPATCAVVINNLGQVLLVKRNMPPKVGQWCLPGGFLELGEPPETGALRELAEETGLKGKIAGLLGVVTVPSAQYHSVIMVGYMVMEYSGRLTPGDDAASAEWFEYTQLPVIAFDSHRRFMQHCFNPDDTQLGSTLRISPPHLKKQPKITQNIRHLKTF